MAIFLRVEGHEFLDLISANMTEGIKQGPSKTFQSTPPVCFSLSLRRDLLVKLRGWEEGRGA